MKSIILYLIVISGIGQILLALGSLAIPNILKWKEKLSSVDNLIKQMFWTYACYIFFINLSFGVISLLAPEELLNKSILATYLSLLIALYWLGRVLIQFFYFDMSNKPKGKIYTIGEILLVGGFVFFTITYGLSAIYNLS
jgi:hypothetical protein